MSAFAIAIILTLIVLALALAFWVGYIINLGSFEQSPMALLSQAMRDDLDYAWSWHCNLACAIMDVGADHEGANRVSAEFMYRTFGVDVTKHREFKYRAV